MRPLKESIGASSPIEAEAIDLLRAAPGHEPPAGQKQRVRAHLLQQRVTHRAVVFRPAVVVAVVLCAAAASAAVGRHWIAETVHSLISPAARRPSAKSTTTASARRARVADAIATPVAESAPPSVAPEAALGAPPVAAMPAVEPGAKDRRVVDASSPAPGRGSARRLHANGSNPVTTRRSADVAKSADAPRPSPPAADEPAAPPVAVAVVAPVDVARKNTRAARPAEDTGLVFDAMRALRQEGQPARASSLLEEYLRRHPGGALAEEALALSVEAATVRREPRARALAAEYLSRYPNGHFRAAVESARRRLAP